ncbi:MAG: Ni/Fe hydrogenase subunit alpha [Bacteroidota bacterium]
MKKTKILKVEYLTRVEGEGAMFIKIEGEKVKEVKFNIFEPPRFFEAFLRGRNYYEAPDITARICGICPVAYQMSSIHAMENIFNTKLPNHLRELRRLLYCGEWIESHTLHIYMLHAPDFLGYDDAIELAKDHPQIVEKALKLKKIGNEIVNLIGGREIHPINVKVGGFYKMPSKKNMLELNEKLKWARDISIETIKLVSKFEFPDFEQDYHFVALRNENEYPFNEGRLVSNKGLDISIKEYEKYFFEEHVEHSNALHSFIKDKGNYFVGPLARFNLNFDNLTKTCKEIAKEVGINRNCKNPFQSIIVRSIENLFAIEEAMRIINNYDEKLEPNVNIKITAGVGMGCTEAPRGILYHRYKVDEKGIIIEAKIVPPTSQNQKTIEEDLRKFVIQNIHLNDEKLTWKLEQAIRNYDPCISCATHFLKLKIEKL